MSRLEGVHYWSLSIFIAANATIFESPPDTVADISDQVTFNCSASGVPLPTISWYRDGSPLDPANFNISETTIGMDSVSSVLILGSLVLSDAGTYSCNASNEVSGTDTRQFTFTIESKEAIMVKSREL